MSPAAPTMDTMLPSTRSSLFNIPQLAEDGMNWITYKERMLTVIGTRGLMRYVDGRAVRPVPSPIDLKMSKLMKPDGLAAMDTEIEELDKKIDKFFMKDSLVKQHIFSTITDRLLLCVQKLDNASKIWEEIRSIHEGKSDLVQIDLRRWLHETRCKEGGDVKAHLGELLGLRELLASMGASLDHKDFSAIIMGSLPESYRPILSSMNAAARVSQKTLSPDKIMGVISEEYEHRVIAMWGTPHR